MAAPSDVDHVNDAIIEDKLIDLWQDFECLYNVSCSSFKDRDKREKAFAEIAQSLGKTRNKPTFSFVKSAIE